MLRVLVWHDFYFIQNAEYKTQYKTQARRSRSPVIPKQRSLPLHRAAVEAPCIAADCLCENIF